MNECTTLETGEAISISVGIELPTDTEEAWQRERVCPDDGVAPSSREEISNIVFLFARRLHRQMKDYKKSTKLALHNMGQASGRLAQQTEFAFIKINICMYVVSEV